MAFSSLVFLYGFLPISLILYAVCPARQRDRLLLLVSLVFYAWNGLFALGILLLVTVLTYAAGRMIDAAEGKRRRRRLVLFSVVLLSIFVVLKYGNAAFSRFGNALIGIALPIGLSFYLFRAYSCLFDVYRGKKVAERRFFALSLYLSRFPEVLSGPISLYRDEGEVVSTEGGARRVTEGLCTFIAGLSKKVLLASAFGEIWQYACATPAGERSVLLSWMGLSAYALRIYYDFSGYSDMAIGLGRCFGLRLRENFRYPYTAVSISDFWRRWHVSLSRFFREYVYIPLGGNRKGSVRTYVNLAVVWLLTGMWHGVTLNFLLWGCYYALLLMVEKALLSRFRLPSAVCRVYTAAFVLFGWLIFAFDQSEAMLSYANGLSYASGLLPLRASWFSPEDLYELRNAVLLFFVGVWGATARPKRMWQGVCRRFPRVGEISTLLSAIFFLLLSTAYLLGMHYRPFLYFKF